MHLSRKVLPGMILFSFVFLTILNAQDKSTNTPSHNPSVAAKTGSNAAYPASQIPPTHQVKGISPIPQAEVDSIVQKMESTFVSAHNQGDAKTLAGLYTTEATILNEFGGIAQGRDTMEHALSASLAISNRPTIQDTPRKSTAIARNAIVTHGVMRITPADSAPLDVLYTKILILTGKQWLIASAQYSRPNPWNVTFPQTAVGASSSKTLSLQNVSETALNIQRWFVEGKAASDFQETNNCGTALEPSASCTVTFTFRPLAEGLRKADLSFWDDAASGRHQIRLAGTAE